MEFIWDIFKSISYKFEIKWHKFDEKTGTGRHSVIHAENLDIFIFIENLEKDFDQSNNSLQVISKIDPISQLPSHSV